ncbi:TetR/AcrR family transcriptional regulator [Microbacterium sp. Sa4CUA7]|uniref:TetR/AcrR family transcriptional regulator n=1 Tax=Microbacterium pullorum TaxID=2762236 RepID=A0ABR8RY12_9MICO|nr:TetR/AcrR family transcriptional regulator [Microbacterium pullorum]MBD7956123.1 TetR/AcrR family transcriptional regulator [Microbacterium pullorum]
MPKITAPTVAEHRASQRAALVRAGEQLLQEAGLTGVTPGSVSERAGMARSSFYDYFPSKDDLLVAIAIDAFERWDADMEHTLDGVEHGLPELRAFVDATMRMTADGRHAIAGSLREANLSPTRFEDLMTLHHALMRPVTRVLADLGVPTSRTTVSLVQGVLGAGVRLVTHGIDPQVAADDVYAVLTRGILPA